MKVNDLLLFLLLFKVLSGCKRQSLGAESAQILENIPDYLGDIERGKTPFLLLSFCSCPASVLENTSCPSGNIKRVKTQQIIVRNGIMYRTTGILTSRHRLSQRVNMSTNMRLNNLGQGGGGHSTYSHAIRQGQYQITAQKPGGKPSR